MLLISRYQFFLQLKQDLYTGKLTCPDDTLIELAAYALQCKFFYLYHFLMVGAMATETLTL